MADYIAFIHKDRTPGYLVTFPDLPGLAITARTLDGVWREAELGLAIHLRAMVEHDEAVPAPSTIDMLARADGYKDAVAVVAIHVSDIAAPTVCVNIVLSEAMLRRIDERAAADGCTRAGFLVQAALKALEAGVSRRSRSAVRLLIIRSATAGAVHALRELAQHRRPLVITQNGQAKRCSRTWHLMKQT